MYLQAGDGGGELDCNHINQLFCNLAETLQNRWWRLTPTQLHLPVAKNEPRLDNEQLSAFTKQWSEMHQ